MIRLRISDNKMERLADLKDFHPTGYWDNWFGLDSNDSPLLMRDTGCRMFMRSTPRRSSTALPVMRAAVLHSIAREQQQDGSCQREHDSQDH